MEKPTKILVSGMICATLVFCALYANTYRLESKLHQLESVCIEEGKRRLKEGKQPDGELTIPSWAMDWSHESVLICDPNVLGHMESPSVGIQAQISQTQHDVWKSLNYDYNYIAPYILLISAIPWLWYFLLRRVRELRDAITGK